MPHGIRDDDEETKFAERNAFLREECAALGKEPYQRHYEHGTGDDNARVFVEIKVAGHAAAAVPRRTRALPNEGTEKHMFPSRRVVRTCRTSPL
jgi:hypothetical protein